MQVVPGEPDEFGPLDSSNQLKVWTEDIAQAEAVSQPKKVLRQVLIGFLWGTILYAICFFIQIGASILNTTTIADVVALVALVRLRRMALCSFWSTAGIVVCSLQLISDVFGIVGLAAYLDLHLNTLAVAVIVVNLLQLTKKVDCLRPLRVIALSSIGCLIGSIALLIGGILSLNAVFALHHLLTELPPIAFVVGMFGMLAPVLVLTLIAQGLAAYAMIEALSLIKRCRADQLIGNAPVSVADAG